MDKKQIRLTEQDLHFLVENAVQSYLTENGRIDEWGAGLGSVLGGAGQAVKRGFGRMKQGAKQMGQNIGNTYQASENLNFIRKHMQNIKNSCEALKNIPDLANSIATLEQELERTEVKYENRLKLAQQRTFSTQNYTDMNNAYNNIRK